MAVAGSPGFTLAEMLVVVVVVAILLSLSVPSFTALAPVRKASLGELKSFVDTARVLAQKEDRDVYLAFADRQSAEEAAVYRRYALFVARDARLAAGETLLNRELRQVTPWESLPPGMLFALGEDFEVAVGSRLRTVHDLSGTLYSRPFSMVEGDTRVLRSFPFLMLNAGGRVEVPAITDSDALHIGVAEGYFSFAEGRVLARPSGAGSAQAECLKINPYTGKSRVITE
jgi:prepilin-type N-terminal cleavage/methylation domain-containing protein